jgi:hypothetical protein
MRDYAATCRDLRIESLERQFLQGGLARVLDAWGFDRCLWGTDWTRAFAVVNYEQA